jgi:plasmid stability protein
MRTLYLRNVPDEVVERLEERAKAESISVNALAVRELIEVSRRYNNAALLNSLPDLGIPIEEIVADIRERRGE